MSEQTGTQSARIRDGHVRLFPVASTAGGGRNPMFPTPGGAMEGGWCR